jgi:GTP-binding protein Era
LDTPGAHEPVSRLNQEMMKAVREALAGVDLVLLLVDASRRRHPEDELALALARSFAGPSLLVLNKIDLVEKPSLLPLLDYYRRQHDFRDYLPVSALTGENLPLLESTVVANLPGGERFYPAEELTDQPLRFLAAEIVREKILHETREEVPHAVAVVVDQFEEPAGGGRGLYRIHATVFVEREGQKGIVIGAQGQRLKKVGQAARKELEALLDAKVFLELFVKTRPDWRDDPRVAQLVDWRHGRTD